MRANINKYPLNKQIASRVSVLVFFAFFVCWFVLIYSKGRNIATNFAIHSNQCMRVCKSCLFIYFLPLLLWGWPNIHDTVASSPCELRCSACLLLVYIKHGVTQIKG